MRDLHLLSSFAVMQPWALDPDVLRIVADVMARHVAGVEPDAADLERAAAINAARQRDTEAARAEAPPAIAVIPIKGIIAPRTNGFTRASGTSTSEAIARALGEALSNPATRAIVLDVDSPGGSTAGGAVVAQLIRDARAKVPIYAVAEYCMASLAYWIGASATEVIAAPGSLIGSIGTYLIHDDLSAALAQRGINRTYISAGEFKTDPNETAPLSPTAKARLQHLVDQSMSAFTRDVAAGRGVSVAAVLDGYGKGDIVTAEDALARGMVDRIGTLSDTIARLTTGRASTAPALAAADRLALEAPGVAPDRAWRQAAYRQFLTHAHFDVTH